MTTTTDPRPLLRVAEGAAYLGISTRSVYLWLHRGVLPEEVAVRCGRAVWLRREILEAWANGRNGAET
jgi:excisionase family DNA binding protein